MKRIAALLLTLAVALCAALPVFAAGTIEVTEDVSVSDDYDWTPLQGAERHPERLQLGRVHLQRLGRQRGRGGRL